MKLEDMVQKSKYDRYDKYDDLLKQKKLDQIFLLQQKSGLAKNFSPKNFIDSIKSNHK